MRARARTSFAHQVERVRVCMGECEVGRVRVCMGECECERGVHGDVRVTLNVGVSLRECVHG